MVTRKNIGGYRLVSLGFLDLALISTATACEGLALALASKSKKRVVLTDIVVSGEPKNDVGVEVEKISGGYAIKNVYGYDLEIVTEGSTLKATPSADHITASEIDSETATAGQALLANGSGGVAFGDIEVGASQIDSGSATSGQVLTADGSGGVSFANPAGGGTKLYKHDVQFIVGSAYMRIYFITDSPSPFAVTSAGGPQRVECPNANFMLKTLNGDKYFLNPYGVNAFNLDFKEVAFDNDTGVMSGTAKTFSGVNNDIVTEL